MDECECGDEDCIATGFCLNSVDSEFWDDPTTGTYDGDWQGKYDYDNPQWREFN